jgi:hypothetical protein
MENDKTFGFTTQQVRLMDILIVTPFLFYASMKVSDKATKYGLIALSVLTLTYNGHNYLKNRKKA